MGLLLLEGSTILISPGLVDALGSSTEPRADPSSAASIIGVASSASLVVVAAEVLVVLVVGDGTGWCSGFWRRWRWWSEDVARRLSHGDKRRQSQWR